MKRSSTLSGVLAWMIVSALLNAGCVVVTVQQGEKNVVDRDLDVNRSQEKEKERKP